MASSKNLFLLFGVLLALLFLISSQVAASHDQTSGSVETDGKGHGHGGYSGKGHGSGGHGGAGGKGGGRGGGKGGGCRYGCCRGYRYARGCNRCCATAHEAHDAQFADDINN